MGACPYLESALELLPSDPSRATVEDLQTAAALGERVACQLDAVIADTQAAQRRLARSRGDGDALAELIEQLALGRQLAATAEQLHRFTVTAASAVPTRRLAQRPQPKENYRA